ncbi:transcriptional regulator, TetR family [Parafrankia sp. EUN1f]|nr:transcriptional regulator, TetR family [Parafrankia sp. EUN1f]
MDRYSRSVSDRRAAAARRLTGSHLPVGLDADAVVTAALALIDADGVAGFTIRQLGERLGVSAPTIYWHVGSKAALLDQVVERVLSNMMLDTDPDQTWDRRLRLFITAAREQLLAHPHVLDLLPAATSRAVTQWSAEALAIMRQAGLTDEDAGTYAKVLLLQVLGYARAEAAVRTARSMEPVAGSSGLTYRVRPELVRPELGPDAVLMGTYDLDVQLRIMIDLLVAGVEAAIERARPGRPNPDRAG